MMSLVRFNARQRSASIVILAILAAIATTSRATIPTATNCPPGQAPLAHLSIQIPKQQQSLITQPTLYTPPITQQSYLQAPQVPPSVPSQLQPDYSNGWGGPALSGSQLQIQQQQQQQQPAMSIVDSVPVQQQASPPSSPATSPAGGDGVTEAFTQIGKQVHKFLLESGPQETSMTVTNGIVIPSQGGSQSSIVMLPSSVVPFGTRSTSISGSIPGPMTPTTSPSLTSAPTTPSPTPAPTTPAPTTPSPTPAPTTPAPTTSSPTPAPTTPAPTTPLPTPLPSSTPTTTPLPPPSTPMISSFSTSSPYIPIISPPSSKTLPVSRRSSQNLFAGRDTSANANAATAGTNSSSIPSSLSQTFSTAANSNGTVSELVKSLMNTGSNTGEDQTTSVTNNTNRTVAEEVAWLMNDGTDRTPSSSPASSSMNKSTNHTVTELIQWLEQTPADSTSTTTVSQLVNWLMSGPSTNKSDTSTSSSTAPPPPTTITNTTSSKAPDTESIPKASIMDLLRSLKN